MKLILAVTKDGGIAQDGKIPWKIADEMKFFREMTLGNAVIMGRKTFESIGKPLPQRENIVVGQGYFSIEEAYERGIELEKDDKIVWVIGGSMIAEAFEPIISEIFLSVISEEHKCDLFVPQYVLDTLHTIQRLYEKKSTPAEDICAPRVYVKHPEYTVYQCFRQENLEERKFQEMIQRVVDEGVSQIDRTGVGTQSIFGHQLSFSLEDGRFPITTLRKAFFKGIFEELMWFLRGQTDSRILSEKGVRIWEDNSRRNVLDNLGLSHLEEFDCGSVYGFQWRHWGAKYIDCKTDYTGQGIDQIQTLVDTIRKNPSSRRLLLSGWNVGDLSQMCLPPCHTFYQFDVSPSDDGGPMWLSCHYYQRSSDILLAGHWNITSASLFTILLAHFCGLRPKKLIVSYGNVHIYDNHRHAIAEHLQRFPFEYPRLSVCPQCERQYLWDYQFEDVKMTGYNFHPQIKMEMNA